MKKFDISKKQYWINHAKKMLRQRLRFKRIRKLRNINPLNYTVLDGESRRLEGMYKSYVHISAPPIFSLTKNPEKTLSFIADIDNCFQNRQKVFVVLKDVETVADGAILVLLSMMTNFKAKNIDFNGDFPRNASARRAIDESGFFDILLMPSTADQDQYNLSRKRLFTHANKKVDQRLTSSLISDISKKIWKEERRCPKLQRVYLELMQNTNNHASVDGKGLHHWWTTVSYDKNENKACFAFIDYGIGVIESMTTDPNSKFFNLKDKITQLFHPNNNAEMLELLIKGKLHSSTGLYYRGKGIPGIYEAFKENKISNLFIISNNVIADLKNDKYTLVKNGFSGTFVYWELNSNNDNIPCKK